MGKSTWNTGTETLRISKSSKEGKTQNGMLRWENQKKTLVKSDNATWRYKSKDINERMET